MQKSSLLLTAALLGLAASASAQRYIAVDSSRNLYDIDVTTGAKTQFGQVSANASTTAGLAYDPSSGTVFLTSTGNDSLYSLDVSTGTATLIGFYGDTSLVMHGLEWDSSTGTLYGGSSGNFYSINSTTGVATFIGATGLASFLNLVHDTSTNTLYATSSSTDSFYSIDRSTGAVTLIGALGPFSTNPNGLAYDPVGDVIYCVDNSTDNLLTIDRTTGVASLVGSTGSGNLLGLVYIPDGGAFTAYCFGDGTGTLCPCGNTGSTGRGCENGTASGGGLLTGSGSTSIAAANVVLSGSGLQPGQPGLYFQGDNAAVGGNGFVNGDGLRCAGGNIRRLQVRSANVSGESSTTANIAVAGAVNAGDTKRYQLWYRNPLNSPCGTTFNLTNGLEVTWAP